MYNCDEVIKMNEIVCQIIIGVTINLISEIIIIKSIKSQEKPIIKTKNIKSNNSKNIKSNNTVNINSNNSIYIDKRTIIKTSKSNKNSLLGEEILIYSMLSVIFTIAIAIGYLFLQKQYNIDQKLTNITLLTTIFYVNYFFIHFKIYDNKEKFIIYNILFLLLYIFYVLIVNKCIYPQVFVKNIAYELSNTPNKFIISFEDIKYYIDKPDFLFSYIGRILSLIMPSAFYIFDFIHYKKTTNSIVFSNSISHLTILLMIFGLIAIILPWILYI